MKSPQKKRVNKELYELGKVYRDYIPWEGIENILEKVGTYPLQEDGERFQGFFCGRSGQAHFPLYEEKRDWLHLSWYKLESGNYEIVAYVG